MDLVQEPAAVRFERCVQGAGRAAGVGAGEEALAALPRAIVADRQIALDQIDLFPIFVHERLRCEHPRRKPQQAGSTAVAALFVERPGQDLLLDAGEIALRRRPAGTHVYAGEFEMGLLTPIVSFSAWPFLPARPLPSFPTSTTKPDNDT